MASDSRVEQSLGWDTTSDQHLTDLSQEPEGGSDEKLRGDVLKKQDSRSWSRSRSNAGDARITNLYIDMFIL